MARPNQRPTRARSRQHGPRPIAVAFVSLGCSKNLIDSEKMLGQLAEHGVIPTADEAAADVVVINTCGFLRASRKESLAAIRRAVRAKRASTGRRVVVAGCLASLMGREILAAVPGVDAVVGANQRDRIVAAVTGQGDSAPLVFLGRGGKAPLPAETARLRLTPRHYAYLRISEGCSRGCSFCTIPAIRGAMRSKPPESVEAEARELIADGALELNLIGQDTTSYGQDLGLADGLADLLARLDRIDGVRWIRLLYAYPAGFSDRIIAAMAQAEHVLPYIDLPLQHINDRMLKLMNRRVTRKQIESLLGRLRGRIPSLAVRTTFITGFPGETDSEHRELVAFVRDFGFDMLGVFGYSQETSTRAGRMSSQVREGVKHARRAELLLAQQEVVQRRNESLVGSRAELLLDRRAEDRRGGLVGRTPRQAPEVDSVTFLVSRDKGDPCSGRRSHAADFQPGQLVPARIVGFEGYDLVAEPAGTPIAASAAGGQEFFTIYQPMGDASASDPSQRLPAEHA